MKHIFASTATVDYDTGGLWIDGVRLPWWMAMPGPEVKQADDGIPILELTVTFFIDGPVTLRNGEQDEKVWDPVLGDVGAYARRQVREEMRAAFPWLEIPA